MSNKVIILDFGSQYTQLIARALRELNVFCEIFPFNKIPEIDDQIKAVVLSGSPFSVRDENALQIDLNQFAGRVPILGICYGAQYAAQYFGGSVGKSSKREYGKASLIHVTDDPFLDDIEDGTQIWMSHGDSIQDLPDGAEVIARTESIPVAAFKYSTEEWAYPFYGIQFHPEVYHSLKGKQLFFNFLDKIAACAFDWTPDSFIDETIKSLKDHIGNDKVILGLSGGVDSTVAGTLLHQAIGTQLTCIFIDNGLLRKDEFETVLESYKGMGLNVIGVDASDVFLDALEGVSDPERKRKIIGSKFIDIFDEEAHKLKDVKWLAQGTIYPDVIESVSVAGPAVTIKSHHNVGGLPEKLKLKIVEPLRMLFKDEVRVVGSALGISDALIQRHPFPGPGLAIRILGAISREKVKLTQEADDIFISSLKKSGLYDKVWQAGAILLPVQSVGVMGDERTYEYTIALRCVNSRDGMTAEWSDLPHDFLASVSSRIINQVKGINRVVYDISTKPPATIEWE
jgi:GMP synthase (glutamine-hydrolysing)